MCTAKKFFGLFISMKQCGGLAIEEEASKE